MAKSNKLRTLALTLLITGAIDSIRNLPASALFGSNLIFFFIIAAVIFLIPSALVSAELSAHSQEGGIYQWVRSAFGERLGFFAVWLQWANNIIWFPTILSFIAGTAAFLINPSFAQNKIYLVISILVMFWSLTLVNLKGIRLSSKVTSFCAITGLIIPISFIMILFVIWLVMGHPIQISLTLSNIIPNWQHLNNWVALTIIMLSFSGMELATVHIKDVNEPQKTFPRALFFSTIIILLTMMFGSLAIAMVLPYNKISLINGATETFSYFLAAYHLNWVTPILTFLLVIGSLGSIISWVVSPVKGLNQAAKQGFLPPFFQKQNKHGVPQNLLLTQAVLVSFVCMAFLSFPSINASYWFLSVLSTQLYMIMYMCMFLSAIRLRKTYNLSQAKSFLIPGKNIGLYSVCLLGLFGCLLTLLVGFMPPDNINIGNRMTYQFLSISGMFAMILPIGFFYWYQASQNKLVTEAPVSEIVD